MAAPRWWKEGARVLVHGIGSARSGAATRRPVARRLRRDPCEAWVMLDERLVDDSLHPFPADDPHGRSRDVPTDCDVCTKAPK